MFCKGWSKGKNQELFDINRVVKEQHILYLAVSGLLLFDEDRDCFLLCFAFLKRLDENLKIKIEMKFCNFVTL